MNICRSPLWLLSYQNRTLTQYPVCEVASTRWLQKKAKPPIMQLDGYVILYPWGKNSSCWPQVVSYLHSSHSYEDWSLQRIRFYRAFLIPKLLSVQSLSCVWLFVTPWTAAQQASLSITNSSSLFQPMSIQWWCHPTISWSAVPFSSCLLSFPKSGFFQMSQFFTPGSQRIGVSA